MKTVKTAFVLALFVAVAAMAASAQATIFIPGNATGYFGYPANIVVPMVSAITVSGPGTITVTYQSGSVDYGMGIHVGPNGGPFPGGGQFPLQEAQGVAQTTKVENMAALIGVFVPQSRTQLHGFTAVDGTKNVAPVGIMPDGLFFVGTNKTITVKEAGTLFLGINDGGAVDNTGGFTVQVSTASEER
jgi:hypothetical protein